MVPEAPLERTDVGLVPAGPGWFVVNARDARWIDRPGRGSRLPLTGWEEHEEEWFPHLGVSLYVIAPGEPLSMYHWEADTEDFLVLAGEALLVVEGEERPLATWDFVHCPPGAAHTIVGAGDGPCAVLAVGAREHQDGPGWGAYPVDETAQRHGAGVEEETDEPRVAYSRFAPFQPMPYREGLLPGSD